MNSIGGDSPSDRSSEDRCRARLKYIHGWRCSRAAVADGLCGQHLLFGALVPSEWLHERNRYGVLTCEGVPPWIKVPAMPATSREDRPS